MRFDSLELFQFGAIEHLALDLSAGDRGLHVIHGANEAGKSTLLRAVRAFLFDVDERSVDTHTFDSKKLRIAATVRGEDGATHELVRRKGRKDTLLVHEGEGLGKTVFDEHEFRRLCTLDAGSFDQLFGLDDEKLREQAESLLSEDGPLGRVLFAASVGGARLKELDASLTTEIDELWKQGGRNQRIPQLLKRCDELRKQARQAALGADEYEAARQDLSQATARLEEIEAESGEVARRRAVVERVDLALEHWVRRAELQQERASLGSLPEIRRDFFDGLLERDRAIENLEQIARNADRAVEDRISRVDQVAPGPAQNLLLSHRERIEAFGRRLPGVHESLERLPIQSFDDLGEGGRGSDPERDRSADLQAIRTELGQASALEESLREAEESTARRSGDRDRLLSGLGESVRGSAADPSTRERIRAIVDEARSFGHGDAALDEESAALSAERERLRAELAGVPGHSIDSDAIVGVKLPTPELVHELCERDREAREHIAQLEGDVGHREDELRRARAEAERLGVGRELPRPEELEDSRSRRLSDWREIRHRWLGDSRSDDLVEDLPGEYLPDEALARRHEEVTAEGDALADRLRSEADAVQHLRMVEQRVVEQEREREALVARLERARHELTGIEGRLREAVAPTLDPEASAVEIRGWVDRLASVQVRFVELAERSRIAGSKQVHRAELRSRVLETAGLESSDSAALEPMLGAAERVLESLGALQSAERELATAEQERETQKARSMASRQRLAELCASLGVDPEIELEALSAAIERVASEVAQSADRERLLGFRGEVETWWESVRADLPELSGVTRPDELVAALGSRLVEALEAEADLRRHRSELEREERERDRAATDLREAGEARREWLEPMFSELGASIDDGAVAEWIPRLRQAADLDAAITACEESLRTAARGFDRTALESALAESEADRVEAELQQLTTRAVELDAERARAIEARLTAQEAVERMTASAEAVALEQDLADTEQELASAVARVRSLETARTLLGRRIEEYRRDHQGPVLEKAGEMIARLTEGRYPGLRTDWNEQDELGLFAVDAAGEALPPSALSSGTRDQLFLALKVATVATLVERGEAAPLPMLLDDVFVHFDDDRSVAGLRVLAELSRSTQVLLFTHHRRLLESASELADEGLDVHVTSLPSMVRR